MTLSSRIKTCPFADARTSSRIESEASVYRPSDISDAVLPTSPALPLPSDNLSSSLHLAGRPPTRSLQSEPLSSDPVLSSVALSIQPPLLSPPPPPPARPLSSDTPTHSSPPLPTQPVSSPARAFPSPVLAPLIPMEEPPPMPSLASSPLRPNGKKETRLPLQPVDPNTLEEHNMRQPTSSATAASDHSSTSTSFLLPDMFDQGAEVLEIMVDLHTMNSLEETGESSDLIMHLKIFSSKLYFVLRICEFLLCKNARSEGYKLCLIGI